MRQRLRQFWDGGRMPSASDWELARTRLDPELFVLFQRQHPRDVVHTAGTARWLLARGYGNRDLIVAALLHDVAKGQQRRVDRVAWVVAGWFGLARLLARAESRFEMRRAMARSRDHASAGAAMVETAGATARTIELIASHHSRNVDEALLHLLQQADAAS